ncbi:MAG: hypothetical protein WCA81_16280 [Rhizomicrobium sp.]|jgi:hypothetical protein
MFFTGLSSHLKASRSVKGWRDNKARALHEAAAMARALAEGEHLPISRTAARDLQSGPADTWYARSILDTVSVFGRRADQGIPEKIEPQSKLHLNADADTLDAGDQPVWRDLQVKREDFARYLDWLRSVW